MEGYYGLGDAAHIGDYSAFAQCSKLTMGSQTLGHPLLLIALELMFQLQFCSFCSPMLKLSGRKLAPSDLRRVTLGQDPYVHFSEWF